jgi:hypothetical protein
VAQALDLAGVTNTMGGGWPRFLISLASPTQWVPRPCVLCKGGYDAADSLAVLNSLFAFANMQNKSGHPAGGPFG